MKEPLTADGYEFTKSQLRKLEIGLAEMESRTDIAPSVRDVTARSYREYIRILQTDIDAYDAAHRPELAAAS